MAMLNNQRSHQLVAIFVHHDVRVPRLNAPAKLNAPDRLGPVHIFERKMRECCWTREKGYG